MDYKISHVDYIIIAKRVGDSKPLSFSVQLCDQGLVFILEGGEQTRKISYYTPELVVQALLDLGLGDISVRSFSELLSEILDVLCTFCPILVRA